MENFWEKKCVTREEVLKLFFPKKIKKAIECANKQNVDLSKSYSEYTGIVTELFSDDDFTSLLEKLILNNYSFCKHDKEEVESCGILYDIAENISDFEDPKDVQDYINENIEEYIEDYNMF